MSAYHILNGDSLYQQFPQEDLRGELIVFREALIEGPLAEVPDSSYYNARADYFEREYQVERSDVFDRVVPEYQKLLNIPEDSDIYLWFERDLFCQVNFWFCVNLLADKHARLHWVKPIKKSESTQWLGYGNHSTSDLQEAYDKEELLAPLQIAVIRDCFKLYMTNDAIKIMHYIKSTRAIYRTYPLYANVFKGDHANRGR